MLRLLPQQVWKHLSQNWASIEFISDGHFFSDIIPIHKNTIVNTTWLFLKWTYRLYGNNNKVAILSIIYLIFIVIIISSLKTNKTMLICLNERSAIPYGPDPKCNSFAFNLILINWSLWIVNQTHSMACSCLFTLGLNKFDANSIVFKSGQFQKMRVLRDFHSCQTFPIW